MHSSSADISGSNHKIVQLTLHYIGSTPKNIITKLSLAGKLSNGEPEEINNQSLLLFKFL